MDHREASGPGRLACLPAGHSFRVQEERKVEVLIPGNEASRAKLLEWYFHYAALCDQDDCMENSPYSSENRNSE